MRLTRNSFLTWHRVIEDNGKILIRSKTYNTWVRIQKNWNTYKVSGFKAKNKYFCNFISAAVCATHFKKGCKMKPFKKIEISGRVFLRSTVNGSWVRIECNTDNYGVCGENETESKYFDDFISTLSYALDLLKKEETK